MMVCGGGGGDEGDVLSRSTLSFHTMICQEITVISHDSTIDPLYSVKPLKECFCKQ